MLSSKYAFLDEPEPGRKAEWIDLKNALFEWERRFEVIQGIVTGDILRHKPTEIRQRPVWIEGWLPEFKYGYNLANHKKAGETESAIVSDEKIVIMKAIHQASLAYLTADIYLMDDTAFQWRRLSDRGLSTTSLGKKFDKLRIAAVL
ncbi:putative jerky protein [Golovinomyces cichoracearum]|uniref:Putative jerky protein n=1 Tax=Golovinomyces cichoracearum TaxID=62708 RepID=A0A420J976_9PEZI|nr:putative jerky protein [Golovinomyces cichoracearum]